MQMITGEIERALSRDLYYLAVSLSLTLPDICAALESPRTDGALYMAWYERWAFPS